MSSRNEGNAEPIKKEVSDPEKMFKTLINVDEGLGRRSDLLEVMEESGEEQDNFSKLVS